MPDIPQRMHRTAGKIAERVLGEDNAQTRRVIYRWASETPPGQQPFPIHKDGRTIFCWEHDIPRQGIPADQ
jgi:hypothetical protein